MVVINMEICTVERNIGVIDIRHIYDIDASEKVGKKAVLIANGVYPDGKPIFKPIYNYKRDAKRILEFLKKEIPSGTLKALKQEIEND